MRSKPFILLVLAWLVFTIVCSLLLYGNYVISDPDDQCNDQSVDRVARFVVCTVERR